MDEYPHTRNSLTAPARAGAEVTPSDTVDLPALTRALYVGTAGDIRVTLASNDTVTFKGVETGFMPIRARRVFATGTTASDIVGVW